MNDLERVTKTMNENTLSQIKEVAEVAHNRIVKETENNKLPEDVFKHHFLGFFSGQQVDPARNAFAEWIGVAGTAMSEVDVVDESNKVLFTVPPLFDTGVIDVTKRMENGDINSILQEYDLRKIGVPIAAANYVNGELNKVFNEITHDRPDAGKTTAERWVAIMGRYGIAPPEGMKIEEKGKKDNPPEDVLIYD